MKPFFLLPPAAVGFASNNHKVTTPSHLLENHVGIVSGNLQHGANPSTSFTSKGKPPNKPYPHDDDIVLANPLKGRKTKKCERELATPDKKHFHHVELLHTLQTEFSDVKIYDTTIDNLPGLTGVIQSQTWLTSTFNQYFLPRASQGRLSTHQQTSQSNCSFSPHLSRRIHDKQ